jgi:succinate-semialdehyde dehydrogenase/glutarate-semialdehyde dehydrogenase
MSSVHTVDPATGTLLAEYPAFTDADVDAALDGAGAAQTGWAARPFAERSAVLRCAGEVLRAEVDDLALLVTREMGKPLAEARAEVEKCATACDYYAEHAAEFSPTSRWTPRPTAAGSATSRSGWCSPSCRGTSRSGRCSGSPPRR